MNFNRGMQMRYAKTVISCAFLIVANGSLGCSGKIEGQYICGNEFYEFTNENNQNIMNIYKMLSATPSNSKPDIVVPLVKKDDVWEGTVTALLAQFKISVSKSKDGIMIVGAGKKENCIRADQAKLIKQYSEKELD